MREVRKEVIDDLEYGAIIIIEGYAHIFEDYIFAFVKFVCIKLSAIIVYICVKFGQFVSYIWNKWLKNVAKRINEFSDKSMFNKNVVFVFSAAFLLLIINLSSVDDVPASE